MLRRNPSNDPEATNASRTGAPDGSEPTDLGQPYVTGERPPGIVFARGPTSFWLPYHLLQGMRYEPDKVTLQFAGSDILIEGRGLHSLYRDLTRQTVSEVTEQGSHAEMSDAATCVGQIVELPKGKKGSPEGGEAVQ